MMTTLAFKVLRTISGSVLKERQILLQVLQTYRHTASGQRSNTSRQSNERVLGVGRQILRVDK